MTTAGARLSNLWGQLRQSLKWRMVLMFLLLALGVMGVFAWGAQRAFSLGWRDAAQPVLSDYLQRLTQDITAGGATPDPARAQALVARLPLTVRIEGPTVRWSSQPAWADQRSEPHGDLANTLQTRTADGHVLRFGINFGAVERRPRFFGMALLALLGCTALAWWALRRMLRPLDAIGAGAQRFGRGDFTQPIALRHANRPDELDQLARTINTMGRDIHQMLEAKRGLLLAISHELRSPLTRARLNAELLPEEGASASQRSALLRDLQEMGSLVNDLLESERLAGRHASLQREPTNLPALAQGVLHELAARHARAGEVRVQTEGDLAAMAIDPARTRLLLRNLLDNALRHGADAAQPPELHLRRDGPRVVVTVRDHGPGVSDAQLQRLAEPFYRPDDARTRAAGGVGLGLTLCRLVAQAHGGDLSLQQAHPGLRAEATLQLASAAAGPPQGG